MKNLVIKWLGLDKIQQENAYLINKVDNLSSDLYTKDWSSSINYRKLEQELDYSRFNIDAEDIADEFSTDDIAREISHCAVAGELDLYDVASNIDMSELSRYIDKDDVANAIDLEDTIPQELERYFEGERMNDFANIVAEKIADRDGMHELVSEEIENQGVGNISSDAVQSMIDTAIQQFADSLEVMVSAKLNINK